jgi:hypothetical protein
MHKHKEYEQQSEYRLAFGIRANVFDFENVEYFVVEKQFQWPRLDLQAHAYRHRMKLFLGGVEDCCRLHE